MHEHIILALISVLVAGCASPETRVTGARDAMAATPATQPVTVRDVLVGSFRGSVFDGEQHLPVVTTFRGNDDGTLAGSYVIQEGEGALSGELTEYVEVWPEMYMCRFTWSDRYGKGILSIFAMPDGSGFRGFWGEEIANPRLKWEGKRVTRDSATRPAP